MIERIVKRPKERIERIIVPRRPEEMPPPDEFVIRLIEAVMVRRRPPAVPPVVPPEVVPVVPPPEEARAPVVPLCYEEDLATGTANKRIDLGIRARYINIRTDEDISIRLKNARLPIPIPAAESPFTLILPPKNWTDRVWVTASNGATFKMITAIEPITVSFGRASPRAPSTKNFWYWQAGATQPADSSVEWTLLWRATGVPYEVPPGKRLVLEILHASTDVKGEVQRVDLYDYDPATGTYYRLVSTYFDCETERKFHYPLPEGHQIKIDTYNYNSVTREFRITIHGYEEIC